MENKIFIKKETMKSIADAIRAKDGTTEEIAVTEMPARIEAIRGINYLDYCNRFNIFSLNLFGAPKVELTLQRATSLHSAFVVDESTGDEEWRRNTTVKELIIHCQNVIKNMYCAFGQNNYYADKTLQKITLDCEIESKNWSDAFNNLQALEVIDGIPLNLTLADSTITYAFGGCYLLREVRFKGVLGESFRMQYSTKLSKDSILSLMVCLSDETTSKTLTLTQAAVNTAFETSSGAADGSTSTEWAELIATKPNWTISLV